MDTYERKYKEALAKAKEQYNYPCMRSCMGILEEIFPELAESEDEKIRKNLIDFFKNWRENRSHCWGIAVSKILAWLEKQKATTSNKDIEKMRNAAIDACKYMVDNFENSTKQYEDAIAWLEKQGDPVEINPTEFDTRLQALIGKFGSLPKEELIGSLSFWMNIVQNDGTYNGEEKQGEQKPQRMISAEAKEALFDYENADIKQKDFAPKEDTPRYSIGDVLCDKSCTTLNKEAQPNFEITDIRNGMYICDKCSFPISQQDEYELVAKRIEQKPTDKVEPKFHKGQWITNGDYTWKIVEIKPLDYILQSQDGNIVDDTISHVDEQFHSFTIQDAKEGDVLYINNTLSESIMIYKSFNNGVTNKYASYNKFGFEGENYLTLNDGYIIPATKEQCDLLSQKMHEAGYMWDSDSKQLLFLKAEPSDEQKPAWSEEDNIILSRIIADYERSNEEWFNAQKSLPHGRKITWLKSLKDRVQPQPKQGWSEEDETTRNALIDLIEMYYGGCIDKSEKNRLLSWLKSLRPQNTWKPSDEQIEALVFAANCIVPAEFCVKRKVLKELLEQLKKLKEG